ncbi:STAS domain-containing protein [Candidatus Riflebacteria bacterium]
MNSNSLSFSSRIAGSDTLIIEMQGVLVMHSLMSTRVQLQNLLNGEFARVIFDMEKVTYIDSDGLSFFITALKKIHGYGGDLMIIKANPQILWIFQLIRLDLIIPILENEDEALSS